MGSSKKTRLLLVEDNKGDARLIKEILKEHPSVTYLLEWRESLHDGIQVLKEQEIDLLLLDLTLPDSVGLDTVTRVLSTAPDLPVIVMTGLNDDAVAIKAMALGAQDYLLKGEVNAKNLARSIQYALERYSLTRARKATEKALDESKKQALLFAQWLEESSQPFAVGYPDGRFGLANKAFRDLIGYTKNEIEELTWSEITPPEFLEHEANILDELRHSKEPIHYEKEYVRKDGRRVPIDLFVHLSPRESGHSEYFYAFVTDITERKRIEVELRARDIRLHKLTMHLPGMLFQFLKKPDGLFCVPYSTDSIRQIFGCSPFDVQDDFSPILKAIHPEDRQPLVESIEISAIRMVPWNFEYRVQLPGQKIRWLLGHSIPEKLSSGDILWHGYNVDITDRKQDEVELQFRSLLLEASIDSIFVHDLSGKFYYVNEAACKAHGYSRAELMGMNLHDLDAPGSEVLINQRVEALKSNGTATFEVEHVLKDGTTMPFEIHAGSATIQGRQLIFSVCRDITERKKAEIALHLAFVDVETERDKAQSYLDIAQTILVALDTEGNITLLNKLGAKILEIDQGEVIGLNWFDTFIPRKDRAAIRAFHASIMSGKVALDNLPHENPVITSKGQERVISWQNCVIRDETGRVIGTLSSGDDITEQKQAEDTLRENEARLRLTLSATKMGLFDLDFRTGIAIISPEYASMLGYHLGEFIPTVEWWQGAIHAEDREATSGVLQSCIAGNASDYQMEFRMLSKDGAWRWIRSMGKVVQYDTDSTPVRLLSIHFDITQQKDAEESLRKALVDLEHTKEDLERLNQELERRVIERTVELKNAQERLVRQEKLAIIGKLAGTVSHELRNPLGVISNSIYYLMTKLNDADEKVNKHLKYIQEASSVATKIISDLLDYARVQTDEAIELDLLGIVDNTLQQINPSSIVKIKKFISDSIPHLKFSARKMQQVFHNLFTNAIQAMPDGGDLEINICSDEKAVEINIKDTGVGISPENIPKLFEPLFTTKQKGIGLGLTSVKEIVDTLKGTIAVESKVGVGTIFKIRIPIAVYS